MPNDRSLELSLRITDDNGSRTNPVKVYTRVPSSDKALDDLILFLTVINKEKNKKGLPEVEYEPDTLKVLLNIELSRISKEYYNSKSKNREYGDSEFDSGIGQKTEFKEENKGIKCPKCGNVLCPITVGIETTLKCIKCGYEEIKKPEERLDDFNPYVVVKEDKDGNPIKILEISNFNVIFSKVVSVDSDARLVDGIFNCKAYNGKNVRIRFEAKESELTRFDEFDKFISKYSCQLSYDRDYSRKLMTSINIDKVKQHESGITVTDKKTQNFGWNNTYTAFLTPDFDYELKKTEDGEFVKDHKGNYELRDFMQEYCDKYGLDRENPDPDSPAPKFSGSVKILNNKIANSIKLGFKTSADVRLTLQHIKNTLLNLDASIDRAIPIIFLSPLTTILQSFGLTYQIYLQGRTGFGKSASAVLFMNFFADVVKDQITNALRDTVNAVEELGFYHKDCLFVIDNYKETEMGENGKKETIVQLLQTASDLQGSRRMSQSGFSGFRIRGCMLVTGEEKWSDASTIRKYDTISLSKRISGSMMDECFIWKDKYSDVTAKYIQWLMRMYGVSIKSEIERRITVNKQYFSTDSVLFALNMTGYELMLDFMLHYKTITVDEYHKMYNNHLNVLRVDVAQKDQYVSEKTNGEKCVATIRAMLFGKTHIIYGDPEYNVGNGKPIGKMIDSDGNIAFNSDMYGEVYSYAKSRGTTLPSQWDTMLPELIRIINEQDYEATKVPTKMPDMETGKLKKQSERALVFPRQMLLPESNITKMPTIKDIADEISGHVQYTLQLKEPPTKSEYQALINHLLKLLPITKNNTVKDKYIQDVNVLLELYFKSKFGCEWIRPI